LKQLLLLKSFFSNYFLLIEPNLSLFGSDLVYEGLFIVYVPTQAVKIV